ncbi:hypothetical protein NR798_24160 [Archangium gephyra]|uniref:hypothetical protein n=1 Tax=Archangium gephyra TaxID=48 RepID=UPI0035D3F3F2
MRKITAYENSRRSLKKGSAASMLIGSMAMPLGTITYGHAMRIELNVEATANNPALTLAQIDDVLESLHYSFRACHSLSVKWEPIQGESLLSLREECRRFLREEYEDLEDSATGLQQALTTGDHVLTFTVYVPLSFAAHVLEGEKVFGLGVAQMLDSSCFLSVESDAFRAISSTLRLKESYVTFSPLWQKGHERFIGLPLEVFKLVSPEKEGIETPPGLVFSAEQLVPLDETLLETMTVTVGGFPVARDAMPEDIQRAYESSKGLSAPEELIADARTLIYGPNGDTKFAQLIPGKLTAKQDKLTEPWALRVVMMKYLTTQLWFELCQLEAKQLDPDVQLLVVNAAVYDRVDTNAGQLGFSGGVAFTSKENAFYENAGVRVANGVSEVYIPPHQAKQYARRIIDAMKPSERFPSGDLGAVKGIYEEAGWGIVAFVVNERGAEYPSTVSQAVRDIIGGYVAEEEQREQQGRQLMGQLQALAQKSKVPVTGGAAQPAGNTPPVRRQPTR